MGHMAASRTLYDILGVPQNASAEAIRKAFKIRALETHPDKLPLGVDDATREAAEAKFRDVRTSFDILSDPAKRQAYDNGLNFVRRRLNPDDVQARLARERAEWQRQAEERHNERMRVLREEIAASQNRYRETMEQVELRYQERMKSMEEQLRLSREVEIATVEGKPGETFSLADEMLSELRRRNPEWEMRKQKLLRRQTERMNSQEKVPS